MMFSNDDVTPETPFLSGHPEADADVRGLICLDFDGALNRLGSGLRDRLPQILKDGRSWGIDLDTSILARMDALVQRPGIFLAWVTTWSSEISLVRPLFNGYLQGGFVVAERPAHLYTDMSGWKVDAVARLAEKFPLAELAWIDDTAVPEAFSSGNATRKLPNALLIAPSSAVGLQPNEVEVVEEYFDDIDKVT